jgi:hypothetical protein
MLLLRNYNYFKLSKKSGGAQKEEKKRENPNEQSTNIRCGGAWTLTHSPCSFFSAQKLFFSSSSA